VFTLSWLLNDPDMQVRSPYPGYMAAVEKYLAKLLPQITDLQVHYNRLANIFRSDVYGRGLYFDTIIITKSRCLVTSFEMRNFCFFVLQWSHGGPIIAVQIENEYGSYGDDVSYKSLLKEVK